MKLTAGQLKDMEKERLKYPVTLTKLDPELWMNANDTAMARSGHYDDVLFEVWRSRSFLVQLYKQHQGNMVRLSVQRLEYDNKSRRFKDGIRWEELMSVKRDVGFGDLCALEAYPPDDLVVDVANIRHLFLLPKGQIPSFVWRN